MNNKIRFLIVLLGGLLLSSLLRAEGSDCLPPYFTNYYGYYISENNVTNADVTVMESRGIKNNPSLVKVSLKFRDKKKTLKTLWARKVYIPEQCVATNEAGDKANLIVTWDYVKGTYNGGEIIATRKGFSPDNATEDPLVMLKGYHTAAYQCVDDNGNVAGYAAVSVNIQNKGKYKVTTIMPNGWKFTQKGTLKLSSDGRWYMIGVSKQRNVTGGKESVAYNLAFLINDYSLWQAQSSDWVSTSPKQKFSYALEPIEAGSPKLTRNEYRETTLIIDDESVLSTKKGALNTKTGLMSGSFKYPVINRNGKLTKKSGKVYGVDVNGEIFGAGYIKSIMSAPAECIKKND